MKRHLTAIGAALLALCMLLAACGGKQRSGGEPADSSGSGIYTSDALPLDLPLTDLTASGAGGGSLYLAGMEEDETEADGELEEDGEFSSSFI